MGQLRLACAARYAERPSLSEAAQRLLSIGFEGIELPVPRSEEEARLLAQEIRRVPITPCNVLTRARYSLTPGTDAMDALKADLVPSMQLAKLSGASKCQWCALAYGNVVEGSVADWRLMYQRVGILAQTAAKIGCTLLVEPLAPGEGVLLTTSHSGCRLMEKLDAPSLALTLDTYHAAATGEDLLESLPLVLPWLGYVHLSDFRPAAAGRARRPFPGRGTIDFRRFLEALANSGYEGFVGIEGFFETDDHDAELEACHAYLRQALPQ